MGKYLDIIRKAQQSRQDTPYEGARALAREGEAQGRDLVDHLREHAPNLLDEPEDRRVPPAESIIATCRRHGIALNLDPDGALRIGKADGCGKEPAIWPSLLMAIEAHAPAVATLVAAGWHLRADVKATAA